MTYSIVFLYAAELLWGALSSEVNYITMCLHNMILAPWKGKYNIITRPISFSKDLQHSLSYLQHFQGRWKILFWTQQLSVVAKTCSWLLCSSQLGFWCAFLRLIQSVFWVKAASVICFTCSKKMLQRWFPRDLLNDTDLYSGVWSLHPAGEGEFSCQLAELWFLHIKSLYLFSTHVAFIELFTCSFRQVRFWIGPHKSNCLFS